MTNTLKNINWHTAQSHLDNINEDASDEQLNESIDESKNFENSTSKSNPQKQLNKRSKLKKICSISNKINEGVTLPEITNQYDLYHKATSVQFIKEKYDIYSNWLAKNNKKPSDLNAKDKTSGDHLNWYEFQKSVYVNEHDCFRFNNCKMLFELFCGLNKYLFHLRFLKNLSLTEQNCSQLIADKHAKKYHSTMGVYTDTDREDKGVKRSVSTDLKKPRKGKETLRKLSRLIDVKNAFYSSQSIGAKGEETGQGLVVDEQRNISIRSSLRNIGSILRAKNALITSKGVHFVPRVEHEKADEQEEGLKRPVVVMPKKALPPIKVRCSDDFYAVLNDINNEEEFI
jgi:hypothetical protein